MRLVAALLVTALAGCLAGDPYPDACRGDGPAFWSYDSRVVQHESDPRQGLSNILVINGSTSLDVFVEEGAAELTWLSDGAQRLALLDMDPAAGDVDLGLAVDGVDCRRFPAPQYRFEETREGATVEIGKGAIVQTAGFWENGTLFYTNMESIDSQAWDRPWPRAPWYAFDPEPLPVYVYDEDRSEIPPHWGAARGLPLPGGDATDLLPGRYATTIPGFNEALKGLSTSSLVAVRLDPEQAYTRPGYESHPLYGDALVFLIDVIAVAAQPCSAATGDLSGVAAETACFRT